MKRLIIYHDLTNLFFKENNIFSARQSGHAILFLIRAKEKNMLVVKMLSTDSRSKFDTCQTI